ncbi:MAG TPA: hypothetical protein ENI64_04280 [Gammaproteobacteria bacterium]|nr:hypothetical protein [Gammaproteobacteria bacterium]
MFIVNPDTADATASGVANSGVINYINKFGANGYKAFDPIGELFYECLNYYKNRGPTPEFSADLVTGNPLPPGDPRLDGFPAITNWNDPIQHACQQNYIVGINDANPWEDKRLPGTSALVQSDADYTFNIANSDDWGDPGNSDPDINVTTETNLVGEMQGINGTIRNIGCVPGDCDWNSGNTKTIDNLGKVFGTAPYAPKENSYYIAGLAYYAASNDIRSGAGDYEGMQTVQTFLIDTQEFNNNPLTGEMNMLWLAGKYGGFNEKNFQTTTENPGNSYQPDQTDEWDEDGDGVPDNYVLANDPAKLVAGLTKAFSNIEGRISAGNAPAVVSDGFNGIGAFYQAIYSPKVRNNAGDEAQWVGQLHALFIDGSGRFREDGNKNGQLDDVSTDNIVELRYNPAATPGPARTQVYRYNTESDYTAGTPSSPLAEIDDLNAIWKAADQLAKLDQSKIHQQRGYTTKIVDNSGAGRYILTWKDKNADGVVGPGEEVAFIASEMDENIMAVVDDAEADRVVAFIRGKEDGTLGYRSRSLGARRFLLGDVVNSAPVSVSLPNKSYDLLKGDTTYGAFRTQYRNRRHVVYVGANDGMLHAFNGGFYDASTKAFKLIRPKESFESTTPKDQPLGSELWAYIPGNLLPHLQWLKELTYPHLYYVDGSPQAFDVNIFPEDSEHPNGWGTILVVNMRFGGGSVTYDHDGKGSTPAITARSAIVVLDITNPETPPNLIAEISDAKLGFTTSKPTLVIQREPGDNNDWSTPNTNNWYLAFGSGPIGSNALTQATSDQSARLYLYDLKLRQLVQFGGDNYLDLAISNAFVGDPASKNWGTDFMDDAIYYGTVAGSVGTPTGGLYRVPLNGSPLGTPSLLLSPLPNQPFTTAPTFTLDFITKDRWVYAGTGRLFVNSDNQSATQQSFYGVKDPGSGNSWGSVSVSDMQNTTGLQVFSSGDMKDPNGVIPGGAVVGGDIINAVNNSDFNRFRKYMLGKKGWFVNFNVGAKNSTRTIFASVTHQAFVLFPEYAPPLDVCTPEGNSRLNALFYRTGTAFAGIGLGDDTSTYNSNGDFLTASFTQYSYGVLSTPGTFITQERRTKLILCDSTASCGGGLFDERLPASGGRRSWREIR